MEIAITVQERGGDLKRILSTHETAGQAFDALAEIAVGDEENYTIGQARYSAPLGIYRIQYVSYEEIERGWITRTTLITSKRKLYL